MELRKLYYFISVITDENEDTAIDKVRLAKKMDVIGKQWYELSNLLKKISEQDKPGSYLTQSSQRLINIYNLEKDFYTRVVEELN